MVIISLLGFPQFERMYKIWSSKSFFHPESKDIFHFLQGNRKINANKKGIAFTIPFCYHKLLPCIYGNMLLLKLIF